MPRHHRRMRIAAPICIARIRLSDGHIASDHRRRCCRRRPCRSHPSDPPSCAGRSRQHIVYVHLTRAAEGAPQPPFTLKVVPIDSSIIGVGVIGGRGDRVRATIRNCRKAPSLARGQVLNDVFSSKRRRAFVAEEHSVSYWSVPARVSVWHSLRMVSSRRERAGSKGRSGRSVRGRNCAGAVRPLAPLRSRWSIDGV